MRVLHVIPSISPKRGGPSTAVMSMVRALRNESINAEILTTSDNGALKANYPLGKWILLDDIPLLVFPCIDSRFRFIREYLISFRLSLWLLRNIKKYDLIHIHSIFSYTTTTAMLIARIKRVPYIIRTIGQLNSWSLTQSKFRKQMMLLLIENGNLARANAIHVTSSAEARDFARICNHKNVICIELGVDTVCQKQLLPRTREDLTRFIYLSRIHPKKQLDILLQAFTSVKKAKPDCKWRLFIAGEGERDYVSFLKRLSIENGISDCIEWMGHISGKQKYDLLYGVDWFVLPSKSENFGISAVEALSCGVPVIISKDVGISDDVQSSGAGIVCNNDLKTLQDAIIKALQGVPEPMREAAIKLTEEKFSWPSIARRLTMLYTSVIIGKQKK